MIIIINRWQVPAKIHCKNIRRFYGKITGNQLPVHFPLVFTGARGGGRVERRCWVNFQCRGVLLVWMIVGQGPIALAIGAGGGCLDIFSLNYLFSSFSPSLGEGPI